MTLLVIAFLFVALLYASVGFGGGSTYNALLVLAGVDYRILPTIALACNIVVVAGGVAHFGARALIPWRRIAPWIAASVPAAFVGGRLPLPEAAFVGLLGAALAVAGVQLLLHPAAVTGGPPRTVSRGAALACGAGLGLLAGVTGIGGGIYLAPLLHRWNWASPREIAGVASLFILVNSLAGLAGQASKLTQIAKTDIAMAYWPLLVAVLIGGQIGSRLGAVSLPEPWLRRVTGAVVLYAAARLMIQFWSLI